MSDIYKYAAQNALRFPSIKGELTVEQLFELPLTSKTGFDLDNIARGISVKLKALGEESFVTTEPNPQRVPTGIALEIVKDVIGIKQAENAARLVRQHRAEERRKILDALATRQDQALSEASVDELEAKLKVLDAD